MQRINFKSKSAESLYDDYLRRVEKTVRNLPEEDRKELMMEINSHIYESIQTTNFSDINEPEVLLSVLQKLGDPEDTLRPMVAERKLKQATRTFNPIHIVKALIMNVKYGLSYTLFGLLYLFLFVFIFLIGAKIVKPSAVGLFIGEDSYKFGLIARHTGMEEVLGWWFIPIVALVVVILYFLITLLLRMKQNRK